MRSDKDKKNLSDDFEEEHEHISQYGAILGPMIALSIVLILGSLFLLYARKFPKTKMHWPEFTRTEEKSASDNIIIEPNSELKEAYKNGTKEDVDQALFHQYRDINDECVGVIRIEGTVLNHPLMQSPKNEAFYLSHDIYKEKNGHGIPFMTVNSDLSKNDRNNIIYGHNMRWEQKDVFYALAGYESLEYYKEHPIIDIVVEGQTLHYIVFAYFISDNADQDAFRYWQTSYWGSDAQFQAYLNEVYKRNWLFTDLPVESNDYFITLSSCSMELSGSGTNRMVVMARRIRPEEDYQRYIDTTTMKASPLLPEKLR